jgi:hypothetical protein
MVIRPTVTARRVATRANQILQRGQRQNNPTGNHFCFSEIMSSLLRKNISLSPSGKSVI